MELWKKSWKRCSIPRQGQNVLRPAEVRNACRALSLNGYRSSPLAVPTAFGKVEQRDKEATPPQEDLQEKHGRTDRKPPMPVELRTTKFPFLRSTTISSCQEYLVQKSMEKEMEPRETGSYFKTRMVQE